VPGPQPDRVSPNSYAGRRRLLAVKSSVSSLRNTFAELYRTLREAPDDLLLELGADGEVLLARLRLLFASLLILLPVINYFTGGGPYESLIGLTGVGMAMLLSQLWLTLARRRRRYRWLPMASACFDVSIVSMVLLLLAFRDPSAGLNSLVVFSCYPLVVLATALRNDVRVTLLCGALAALPFMAISMFFMSAGDQPLFSPDYGTVHSSTQLQRMLLLLASTLVTALIVFRMQRLIHVSGTDGLTGLPNRSYLNHRVPQLITDARSSGDSLCLCLIDLDYFKRINDELGHQAGDRALRHIVDTLRMELRRDEALLRVGGEEFVLILRMPLGAAWERMDALRRRVEIEPFQLEDAAGQRILTFSAGIACCPADGVSVSVLMGSADARLRTAKLTGRNRVIARDAQ
jgi:two-component system cell cycle response regulator